jgi:DNA-3-methyladenine glycosylase II
MDSELLKKAHRHLQRRDAVLKPLIKQVGLCTLHVNPDHFDMLIRAIVSQQISTKAAEAISARLLAKLKRFQPKRILSASDDELREAGLSRSKRLAMRDLAEHCASGKVPLRRLAEMTNEEVIDSLVQVRGIGPWTAEMFMIFSLGRPDILPIGDYGLRAGVKRHYQLAELPKKDRLHEIGETWKPYRSIATWYIWRSLGNVPQSDE